MQGIHRTGDFSVPLQQPEHGDFTRDKQGSRETLATACCDGPQ